MNGNPDRRARDVPLTRILCIPNNHKSVDGEISSPTRDTNLVTDGDQPDGEIHRIDCPECGHVVDEWCDCPSCGWYSVDHWDADPNVEDHYVD